MSNYISEQELNSIKGLLHYLNENMPPSEGLGVDANVHDANGESLGLITYNNEPGAGYVLKFPS